VTKKIAVVVMLFFVSPAASSVSQRSQPLIALEKSLDSALENDEPIQLTESTDFYAPHGAVIFLSRKAGTERMIAIARSGEPELCMVFLPQWNAWITDTKTRKPDESRIEPRYIVAALGAGMDVEGWHTHNNLGQSVSSEEEAWKRSIRWTMPSPEDLIQLYSLAREIPGGKLKGVVASIYGTMTYWNDDPSWAAPQYVRHAIRNEGHKLNLQAGEVPLGGLSKYAKAHKGFVKLKFEPAH
jgi:hypothetical protein